MILTPGNCSVKMSRYGERDSERQGTTTGHRAHASRERDIVGGGCGERFAALGATHEAITGGLPAGRRGRPRRMGIGAASPRITLPRRCGSRCAVGDGEVCRLQSGAFDRAVGRRGRDHPLAVKRATHSPGAGNPQPAHAARARASQPAGAAAQAGMLVQIDASPHDWLEGRGPRLTLFAAIDDATGEVLALLFRAVEDAQGYFLLVRMIVTTHGRPLAFYHDRHGIFRVNAKPEITVAEQLAGEREPTQFGRLLDELGIASIAARSPQAKGRVERLFGTLQDRLVSVLRLAGATNEAEATACLPDFLGDFNGRFTVPAAEEGDCYRALEGGDGARDALLLQVSADGWDGQHGALRGASAPTAAGAASSVVGTGGGRSAGTAGWFAGGLLSGECLATTPAPPEAPLLRARGGRRGSATAADAPVPIAPRPPVRRERATARPTRATPGKHHPWKRGFQQRRDKITGQLE